MTEVRDTGHCSKIEMEGLPVSKVSLVLFYTNPRFGHNNIKNSYYLFYLHEIAPCLNKEFSLNAAAKLAGMLNGQLSNILDEVADKPTQTNGGQWDGQIQLVQKIWLKMATPRTFKEWVFEHLNLLN